jgi:hypothetical protein
LIAHARDVPKGMPDPVPLAQTDRLDEYDIILCEPTLSAYAQDSDLPRWEVRPGNVGYLQTGFALKREETRLFLERGGVMAAFLGGFSGYTQEYAGSVYALELIVDEYAMGRMRIDPRSGRSLIVLDEEHRIAAYLAGLRRWEATLDAGGLVEDPHAYPLAESRDGRFVAMAEEVGSGSLYWIPPPREEGDWRRLRDALVDLWNSASDLREHNAFDDDDSQLRTELSEARVKFQRQQHLLLTALRERRAEHARFVDEDRAVHRVLELQRLARKSGPVRALDVLSRMLDRIEDEYGGERNARHALGYAEAHTERITRPANDQAYRARHEGKKEPERVPDEVIKSASAAADEIVHSFIQARLVGWRAARETPSALAGSHDALDEARREGTDRALK